LLFFSAPTFAGSSIDQQLYAELLSRYTRTVSGTVGTQVDYPGLRADARWPRLIESVARSDISKLRTRSEKLAFWINVYNIFTIDILVKNEPVASIRDLGSSFFRPIWKMPAGRIGSRTLTLDEIEHEILRPMGAPRIHVAIVCASTSCPSLLREPWDAARLSDQLDAAMRRWIAEPRKGLRIDRGARVVHMSRIFEWFEEDFEASGGPLEFVLPYLSPLDRVWLTTNKPNASIEYFEYDWGLNAASTPASPK
jgi:hypothetical protein